MTKILVSVFSRAFIIGLSVVAIFAFSIELIFSTLSQYSNLILGGLVLISAICVFHIILKDTYPEYKIAWIVFMLIVPEAGGIFYIIFAKHRVTKQIRIHHEKINQNTIKSVSELSEPNTSKLSEEHSLRHMKYLRDIAHAPAFENTSVTYFPLGEDMFEAMLSELKKAEKFIFIESFIIEEGKMWGEIENILIEKAKAGVDIRVLFDDLGCILTLPPDFSKRLKNYGIDCRAFNKVNHVINAKFNNRDHRKICVIDGNVGFNGGINLADEYINHKVKHGHWKDTAVMLKGDAVYGLTMMFLSMWDMKVRTISNYEEFKPTIKAKSDGIIQPFSDSPIDDDSVGESIYMSILNNAKDYVYITSPYLIISREMTVSLQNAAKSGIDVRLILPSIPDKKFVQFLSRSYYETLIKSGVKIYEYTPGFIHSKMFISDDNTAIVGTINLDYRSLDLHYECATMMYECSVIKDIKNDFIATLAKSEEVTYDMIKSQSKHKVVKFFALSLLRSFSPLM